jgi:hypothetical protein
MLPKPRLSALNAMMDRVIELSRLSTRLEFEAFEALPCGCVAGAYRASPWALNLVRLEAKGPHCVRAEHAEDQVLDVEVETDEEEDENEF